MSIFFLVIGVIILFVFLNNKDKEKRISEFNARMAEEKAAEDAVSDENVKNVNDLYDRLMRKKSFYEDNYFLINETEWKAFISRFWHYKDLTWTDKRKVQDVPYFINMLGTPVKSVHNGCQVRSTLEGLMSLYSMGEYPEPTLDIRKERVRLNMQMVECIINLLESTKTIHVSKQGLTDEDYLIRSDVFTGDFEYTSAHQKTTSDGRVFGSNFGSVELGEFWSEYDTLGFYKRIDDCLQWKKECEERGKKLIK